MNNTATDARDVLVIGDGTDDIPLTALNCDPGSTAIVVASSQGGTGDPTEYPDHFGIKAVLLADELDALYRANNVNMVFRAAPDIPVRVIKHDRGPAYRRHQADKWSNKYSHKRR